MGSSLQRLSGQRSAVALGILLLLAGLIVLYLDAGGPTWTRQPNDVTLERIEVQLGQVESGASIAKDLVYVNSALRPRTVRKVSKSCSCAVAEVPGNVEPGATMVVPITIMAPHVAGRFSSRITIEFEDGSSVVAEFHGLATRPVPANINVGRRRLGEDISHVISIVDSATRPTVRMAPADDSSFSLRVDSDGNGGWNILIRRPADAREGPIRARLLVRVGGAGSKEWEVAIEGYVIPLVEVAPSPLVFGIIEGVEEARELRVYSRYDVPIIKATASVEDGHQLSAGTTLIESNGLEARIPLSLRGVAITGRVFHTRVSIGVELEDGRLRTEFVDVYALKADR